MKRFLLCVLFLSLGVSASGQRPTKTRDSIAERTFRRGQRTRALVVAVDPASVGWVVELTCDKWPAGPMGQMFVVDDKGNRYPGPEVGGGGMDSKTGLPYCTTKRIRFGGDWWSDEAGNVLERWRTITVELLPTRDMVTAVTIDGSVRQHVGR